MSQHVHLVAVFALSPVLAAAQAGLLVPTGAGVPDAKVLSLREMRIDLGIARGYARVSVRQVFENHTDSIQEGTYRFALPPSAAVGDFAVWDGRLRIPGVILEKQRARRLYSELTAQRIDPGLLQQGEEDAEGGTPSAGGLFSARVAPIPARGTKRVEVLFQQELPFASERGEFRLALKPPEGTPPTVGELSIEVFLADVDLVAAPGLPLVASEAGAGFSGRDVVLDRDLIVKLRPKPAPPLRLTAFRNPEGRLPDGLALPPWERASEIPPEKDGFFLLEMFPPGAAAATAPKPPRAPVTLVALFDTSLSHRFAGLESSYANLVRALGSLRELDRFALIPFDAAPAATAVDAASPATIEAALASLQRRPLAPGTDFIAALRAARRAAGVDGRILLLTDGHGAPAAKAISEASGGLPLFAIVSGEAGESLRGASRSLLQPTATSLETDLFFERLTTPLPPAGEAPAALEPKSSGPDARLRDVYAALIQPPAPGAVSGWIGRYGVPQREQRFRIETALLPERARQLDAALPERALEARDLPRRWARARVDFLLAQIEGVGERREWIEEIVALSKRYKFITPYTAFLAAPRSLLRPRRIQPGDPVLRVDCDPGIVSATALLPFGLRLELVKRPTTTTWEGRFVVPEDLRDGRYEVRVLLRDRSGARITEQKAFVLDGAPPTVKPEVIPPARAGTTVLLAARADADVVLLQARIGDHAPVPLRWDQARLRSTGLLYVPAGLRGTQQVVFEAVDGAKNRGFATGSLEVYP